MTATVLRELSAIPKGFLPGEVADVQLFTEHPSTNEHAMLLARRGDIGRLPLVIVADRQTQGRGRSGRVWFSPPDENVYLSIAFDPELPAARVPQLALVAGVAVARVVDKRLPSPTVAKIKWPNDVQIGGRKIAGVLVESVVRAERAAAVVIGVGVNVRTVAFPVELSETATSLALAGAHALDRALIVVDLVRELMACVASYRAEGLPAFARELSEKDALRGKPVAIAGGAATASGAVGGMAMGIDGDGRLLVQDASGALVAVSSGEVAAT
jgi:BirA family biotin operon repressor/biotin-[acetyl-CoA-carboxylase] ligase